MVVGNITLKKFILPAAFFIALLSIAFAFAYNNPQETLRFDEVYGPDRADIYFELTDSVAKTLLHDAAIQTSSGQGVISNASIAILKNLSLDRFKRAILHEIGHAIGLSHSLNRNDIMSVGTKGLSFRDKNTARLLYK